MLNSHEDFIQLTNRIGRLPKYARTAFAARCARRVQTLYEKNWPHKRGSEDTLNEHLRVIDGLISISERASVGEEVAFLQASAESSKLYKDLADIDASEICFSVGASASAAYVSAHSNEKSGFGQYLKDAKGESRTIFAAEACIAAFAHLSKYVPYAELDLQAIESISSEEDWNDESPVPPEVFGPLWPDRVPAGGVVETSESAELVVNLDIPDDATDEQVKEIVAYLTGALNDTHKSLGGHGLEISSINIPRKAAICEGVS